MVDEILYTRGESHWTVPGVQHREKVLTVDVQDGLLDNMTIAQGIALAKKAQPNEFRPASMPFNYSVIKAASNLSAGKPKETLQEFLQNSMRDSFILTLTDVDYMPSGMDKVTHFDIVSKKPYSQNVRVVAPDRFIEEKDAAVLGALVGTEDIDEINAVSNWANKTNAYIWRLNNTPSEVVKRVASFDADSDWLGLDCYGPPEDSGPSFGVRVVREAQRKK